jgi:hypothetical protein
METYLLARLIRERLNVKRRARTDPAPQWEQWAYTTIETVHRDNEPSCDAGAAAINGCARHCSTSLLLDDDTVNFDKISEVNLRGYSRAVTDSDE